MSKSIFLDALNAEIGSSVLALGTEINDSAAVINEKNKMAASLALELDGLLTKKKEIEAQIQESINAKKSPTKLLVESKNIFTEIKILQDYIQTNTIGADEIDRIRHQELRHNVRKKTAEIIAKSGATANHQKAVKQALKNFMSTVGELNDAYRFYKVPEYKLPLRITVNNRAEEIEIRQAFENLAFAKTG